MIKNKPNWYSIFELIEALFLPIFILSCLFFLSLIDPHREEAESRTSPNHLYYYYSDRALYVSGELYNGDENILINKYNINQWNEIDTVVLWNLMGGTLAASRNLAAAIKSSGKNTEVQGDCASACIDIFVAGKERKIGVDGRLGVHRAFISPDTTCYNTDFESAQYMIYERWRYYESQGLNAAPLIFKTLETDSSEVHWLTEEEISTIGLVTEKES